MTSSFASPGWTRTANTSVLTLSLGLRETACSSIAGSFWVQFAVWDEDVVGRLNITKDQAISQIADSNFLKVPATVTDTANAAVLIASDSARMLTGTVVNGTADAALD